MMKTVARGGMPNIPGMGPMPGVGGGRGKPQQAKKKGSKSGNPAKRAAENLAIASGEKPAGAGAAAATGGGTGFGLGGRKPAVPGKPGGPTDEEMAALQKMLGR
jgi:signal recognition particle subunit SRP54